MMLAKQRVKATRFQKNPSLSSSLLMSLVLLFLMERLSPVSVASTYFNYECKGVYDKSIYAKLDRICEDCYNLFREPALHSQCRKNCFTTDYFKGCIDTLLLQDKEEEIKTWIKQIHGAESGV